MRNTPFQTKLTTYMKYRVLTLICNTQSAHGIPYTNMNYMENLLELLYSNFAGLNFSFFFFSYV